MSATAVFSKSYCPYCKSTKSLLSDLGAKSYIIELDQVGTYMIEWHPGNTLLTMINTDDGAEIQDALEEMTGQRSVPNIFIGKKHIGGNSELQGKKSQLPSMLKDVQAV